MLQTENSGFGGQNHAPNVARASAGMVLAVSDQKQILLLHS